MKYKIREIKKSDDARIEGIIRSCLIEFGANHDGTAWADPNLSRFSEIYNSPGNKYWVAEDENGEIVGGAGIGELHGVVGTCELQKMYCVPKARGTGAAWALIETAESYARKHYSYCYLETLENMNAAHKFYEKHGFSRTDRTLGNTGHYACGVLYIKRL